LKGITIWILGFLAFLAVLNSVNAIVLWAQNGPDMPVQPYLIGNVIGGVSVSTYLWISILATFIFLGLAIVSIVRTLTNATILENVFERVRNLQIDQTGMRENVTKRLNTFDSNLFDIRTFLETRTSEVAIKLKEMGKAVQKVDQKNKRKMATIIKQMKEVATIRLKLEKLAEELAEPKPRLTSKSELRKVKGIGTCLENDLKRIGITNVGDLILTDPLAIAEKANASQRRIQKLQGRAQLLMIPGITEKDLTLLENLGIATRRELANQDPIDLCKKTNGILNAYIRKGKFSEVEKPTIEQISSWIKAAKS